MNPALIASTAWTNPIAAVGSIFGSNDDGGASRQYTSDPRGAGFSLIGPTSGYPKTWVNNSGRVLSITDKVNTYQVSPGGKITQLGDPIKGKIEIISGGSGAEVPPLPTIGGQQIMPDGTKAPSAQAGIGPGLVFWGILVALLLSSSKR